MMRLPVITLLMIGPAVLIAQFPCWSSWLVYDRSAILGGEIWRMFTGHWVHFSTSHLIYDSLVLGVAGWMIEVKRLPNFGWLCLLTPWLISGLLLMAEPQMEWFGGLSALATAAVVYLAMFGLHDAGLWRWACLATLLGIACKVAFEITTGQMIFATVTNKSVAVSSASHVCGTLVALLFYRVTSPASRTARPARRLEAGRAWRRFGKAARP